MKKTIAALVISSLIIGSPLLAEDRGLEPHTREGTIRFQGGFRTFLIYLPLAEHNRIELLTIAG